MGLAGAVWPTPGLREFMLSGICFEICFAYFEDISEVEFSLAAGGHIPSELHDICSKSLQQCGKVLGSLASPVRTSMNGVDDHDSGDSFGYAL